MALHLNISFKNGVNIDMTNEKEYTISYSGLISVNGEISIVASSAEEATEKFYDSLNAEELCENSLILAAREDLIDVDAIE